MSLSTTDVLIHEEFEDCRAAADASVVSIHKLKHMLDCLEQVVYCHPLDRDHPLIRHLEGQGYRIATRQSLAGRACIKNAAKISLVDFEADEALVCNNSMLRFAS